MKLITLLSLLLVINSCDTKKAVVSEKEKEMIVLVEGITYNEKEISVNSSSNSTLTIKEDTIGELYPVIESGENIVIDFTYEKKAPEGIADGDYSETLHFEIPKNTTVLNLNDASLNDVKLLFGKHCFCRGEAGYYNVKKGNMKIIKTDNEIFFDITFTVDETSTKLERIAKHIKL